jgi:dihydrofolate reductase
MRKLIVSNIMSLDGYYEGPGKNVMVLPMDEAFDTYNAERLRAADTLLLGRNTYDGFKGFWPSVADDPNFTPCTGYLGHPFE